MSSIARYARIVKNLGYQMEHISPVKGKIHIPGGIPYEAFDSKDGKVKAWSILALVESAYLFSSCVPSKSLFDIDRLFEDKFLFANAMKLTIFPELYKQDTNKFPINIIRELSFIGESSFITLNTITSESTDVILAIAEVSQISFDHKLQKQTGFPQWWIEKFQPYTSQKSTLQEPIVIRRKHDHYKFTYNVLPSDTDGHKHTNWAKYLQICYDACAIFANQCRYQYIDTFSISSGIRSVLINYRKESFELDTLTIHSWEEANEPGVAHLEITNEKGYICCQSCIEFMRKGQRQNVSKI